MFIIVYILNKNVSEVKKKLREKKKVCSGVDNLEFVSPDEHEDITVEESINNGERIHDDSITVKNGSCFHNPCSHSPNPCSHSPKKLEDFDAE